MCSSFTVELSKAEVLLQFLFFFIILIMEKYIEKFTAKNWKFLNLKTDIFQISAQSIDYVYLLEPPRGGSNEYPQSMFLSRNKKNNAYPSFTI